jgi:hypothetical protein
LLIGSVRAGADYRLRHVFGLIAPAASSPSALARAGGIKSR